MFDISWQDPAAETVRSRKSRANHQSSIPRPDSAVSSASSESSTRKPRPSVLTLFHRSSKRDLVRQESQLSRSSRRSSPTDEPLPSPVRSSRQKDQPVEVNVHEVAELASPDHVLPLRKFTARAPPTTFYLEDVPVRATELPLGPSRGPYTALDEQNFTRWATQSVVSDSSWGSATELARRSQLVQPLSPTSFHSCLTQETEVTIGSQTDSLDAKGDGMRSPTSRAGTTPEESERSTKRPYSASSFEMPLQHFNKVDETLSRQDEPTEKPIVAVMMTSAPTSPRKIPVITVDEPSNEAAMPSVPSLPPKSLAREAFNARGKHEGTVKLDLSYFQKSVRRMEAASVKIVLERLTEEWTGIPDASLYVELDLEKKLWMRTALHTSCQETPFRPDVVPPFGDQETEPPRLLSLYEDHASTTFLSALNPTAEIHHLSPYPLLTDAGTNLRPLFVPGLTSGLPYVSEFFTTIHASLSIAALLPSASIPPLLRECARTLAPNQTLHLVLMDPTPIPSTAGPFLRSWLDCNLVIPLEHAAHCIHPSTLFPMWLADAGLNGVGSSTSSQRFAAAAETALIVSYNQGEGARGAGEETRQELKRMVGMLLWEETWGGFIKGKRRWWNDREVMAECVRLGTMWEYQIVEAVKEG